MAASVVQLWKPATGTLGDSLDVPYAVFDAADEGDVYTAALADVPATYESLPRRKIELDERVNDTTWTIRVHFEAYDTNPTWVADPDSTFAFDTTGGTQHITQARATVGAYGANADATDNAGAIGFDGKNVAGADIIVPVFNFSETHYFDHADVDEAYRLAVFNLTGRTNNAAFRGFAAGEVLFLGAQGNRRGDDWDDKWEIVFRFSASPNEDDLDAGDISGIDKDGWNLLDVRYKEQEGATQTTQLFKVPKAVYVHRVYRSGNFDNLELPT